MRSTFALLLFAAVMFASGALGGARHLHAEKAHEACGKNESEVCHYESDGCDAGEVCQQYACSYGGGSCLKGDDDETRCWLCREDY